MILAYCLVYTLKGGGIALALSAAGAVNTLFLLLFLRKNPRIAVVKIVRGALLYSLKIAAFSLAAVLPVHLVSAKIDALLARSPARGKLLSLALPLAAHFALFALTGAALLLLSKDKYARALLAFLKKRR
jgi:putative peptidoglycan lipid II flippase